MYTQLNTERIEQEEYIALQRAQRVGLVETDTVAVMEWTWERKTNVQHSLHGEPVVLYRNVPRYRGQDIHRNYAMYPANEESTRAYTKIEIRG